MDGRLGASQVSVEILLRVPRNSIGKHTVGNSEGDSDFFDYAAVTKEYPVIDDNTYTQNINI